MKCSGWVGVMMLFVLAVSGCGPVGDVVVPPTELSLPTVEPTVTPTATPVLLSAADWVLEDGQWESYTTDDGLPHNYVRSLAVDRTGSLWFATERGGGWFDGANWNMVVVSPVGVTDIDFDDQGRVWLADGLGAEVYDGNGLTTYSEELSSFQSKGILVGQDGRVWVSFSTGVDADGSGGGGIDVFDGETWVHYGVEDGLFGMNINGLAEDREGNIWAAGDQGMAWFDGSAWQAMMLPDQPDTQTILCVAVDADGRVWFGTKQLGLWIWDGATWTHYMPADGLASDTVWAIGFDGAGRAWVGTSGGLTVIDGERWLTYTTADGLVYNEIRALAFAREGVWVGTWRGLSYLGFE